MHVLELVTDIESPDCHCAEHNCGQFPRTIRQLEVDAYTQLLCCGSSNAAAGLCGWPDLRSQGPGTLQAPRALVQSGASVHLHIVAASISVSRTAEFGGNARLLGAQSEL